MKRLAAVVAVLCVLMSAAAWGRGSSASRRTEHVSGYTRKDGTHVRAYYRAPSGTSDAPTTTPRVHRATHTETTRVHDAQATAPVSAAPVSDPATVADTTTITTADTLPTTTPNTGGESLLMSLAGLTLAFGALRLRRCMAA
jgi:hypothetical protein